MKRLHWIVVAAGAGMLVMAARLPADAQATPAPQARPAPEAVPAPPAPWPLLDDTFEPFDLSGLPDPWSPDFSIELSDRINVKIQSLDLDGKIKDKLDSLDLDGKFKDKFEFAGKLQTQPPEPVKIAAPRLPPMPPMPPIAMSGAEGLYDAARSAIDSGRYDRALDRLNQLLRQYDGKSQAVANRVDAALYWKAYSQGKQQQMADALDTLADMQKRYTDSRWLRDAKALELELRQSSGQAVSADQADDELKLLALRNVMRSDPDQAVPIIERLLAGNSSVNVKENALFVLSQSQSPRARDIVANAAKNSTNPELQLRAVRYLGAMRGADTAQTLDGIYRSSSDTAIKRAILRAFMTAGDRARLLAVAKSESSVDLRGEAAQQLGAMHADAELGELYQAESSADVKKRIIQAFASSGNVDKMVDIARNEKDQPLRRTAIRDLGTMNAAKTTDVLRTLYRSENDPDIKKEIINALSIQRNAPALIEMARAERDAAMKKEIVTKLSTMRNSKEATDYMLELLK